MDKKSRILIALLILGVFFSIALLYKKTMIDHDFAVLETESGIPEISE